MRRYLATSAVLGGLVAGSLVGTAGVAAAAPRDTCGAYASTCPSPDVKGIHFVRNPTGDAPSTQVEGTSASRLPFTGGEIALMVVVGVGAIGAGTAFAVSGRRRRSAAH
jgi:hypothetical protein